MAEEKKTKTKIVHTTLDRLPYGDYNYDTIMSWKETAMGSGVCGIIKDFNMLDALHATDEDYTIVFGNGGLGYSQLGHLLLEIAGDHDEAKSAIDAVYKKHSEEMFGSYVEPDHFGFVKDVIASLCLRTSRYSASWLRVRSRLWVGYLIL